MISVSQLEGLLRQALREYTKDVQCVRSASGLSIHVYDSEGLAIAAIHSYDLSGSDNAILKAVSAGVYSYRLSKDLWSGKLKVCQ